MGILTGIILAAAIAGLIILNLPAFGRLPRGSRLERILRTTATGSSATWKQAR